MGAAEVGTTLDVRGSAAPRRRPFLVRQGKKLRRRLDGFIARSSIVANDPVLDAATFEWTSRLAGDWEAIRSEALMVLRSPSSVPLLDEISPDHARIAPPGKWRSFFLRGYGIDFEDNVRRCPRTWAALETIPGLNSAFLSILAPGTRIPSHRGVTKGLLTCHLGLIVPRGPVGMRVGEEIVGWSDGGLLLFDDTYRHEVWNDTESTRVVLLVQFARPLRAPGSWLATAFLAGVKRSAFVREAHANIVDWGRRMTEVEAMHGLDA